MKIEIRQSGSITARRAIELKRRFVVAGELVADTRRSHQFARGLLLLVEMPARPRRHRSLRPLLGSEGQVSGEECVFGLDHLRTADIADIGELGERHDRALGTGDQDVLERLDRITHLAGVAYLDTIALTPFDSRGNDLSTHGQSGSSRGYPRC